MLLAKRFTLNPVPVIISLVFWFWMWGIPGAILSVPMLAIAKIICDRFGRWLHLAIFSRGENPAAVGGSGLSNCSRGISQNGLQIESGTRSHAAADGGVQAPDLQNVGQ
jgi:hypothetical protein